MAQRYFPVRIEGDPDGNSEPLSDAQWGELFARVRSSGVDGSPGGTALQAYRTASGLFVRPGVALNCGVFFEVSGADQQITGIPQNTGTTVRNDLLVLRRNLASSPNPKLTYITGGVTAPTPQANPAGIYDVPLAMCQVAEGSTVPANVLDTRRFLPADVLPCRTTADIPTALRRIGTVAAETTGTPNRLRWWTGYEWQELADAAEVLPKADMSAALGTIRAVVRANKIGFQLSAQPWRRYSWSYATLGLSGAPTVVATADCVGFNVSAKVETVTATTAQVVVQSNTGAALTAGGVLHLILFGAR